VDAGLQLYGLDKANLQYTAGRVADIETLVLAEEFGLPFSDSAVEGAAHSGCLKIIEILANKARQCDTSARCRTRRSKW
jgi:hypothetical protein